MSKDILDVAELQSMIGARLNQFETGELAVISSANRHEDCTPAMITDLKTVLAYVNSDRIRHESGQSALGGPSFLKPSE